MVADEEGTRANAFEENDSGREPNTPISTLFAGDGAAKKKCKDIMSINVTCKVAWLLFDNIDWTPHSPTPLWQRQYTEFITETIY